MELRTVPTWTDAELATEAQTATDLFVRERLREGPETYSEFIAENTRRVTELLEGTDSLRTLTGRSLIDHPEWLDELRYLAGPPVSFDDLQTMVGTRLSVRQLSDEAARRVVSMIQRTLDPFRFVWIGDNRTPNVAELERAISWTAGLKAVEQLRTYRRNTESIAQEQEVRQLLTDTGYTQVGRPGRQLGALDDLPRGSFTAELKIAGSKADVPIRLFDGRLLAIECKASNSAINSVKRLNREVGGKADLWRAAYGRQIIPCAVISGVFGAAKLIEAQNNQGVFIVWQHNLRPLEQFIAAEGS